MDTCVNFPVSEIDKCFGVLLVNYPGFPVKENDAQ